MSDFEKIVKLLMDHFKDEIVVAKFLRMGNGNLGNSSPLQLIEYGRINKVLKFIETSLDENKREE